MADINSTCVPLKNVKKVQFGLLSASEILKISVLDPDGVIFPEKAENGIPKRNGLMDSRQGPVDRYSYCETCSSSVADCPGHFGHINLAKPVYHIGFKDKIIKVLRLVCYNCSQILINKNDPQIKILLKKTESNFQKRFDMIVEQSKKIKSCVNIEIEEEDEKSEINKDNIRVGCNFVQPKISRNGLDYSVKLTGEHGEVTTKVLQASQVYDIFKRISNEDCLVMGFDYRYSRPESMILTVLAVPPMAVRPAIVMNHSGKAHDDLTHKLTEIVKVNQDIKQSETNGATSAIIMEKTNQLQYHVATLFDNESTFLPTAIQKSGRPLKSLKQRLKGKSGRVRANLMGKRTDFTARTVITADPNLNLDQVGVPILIARNLTFPETVTPINKKFLENLVWNGNEYPGAKYLIRENGDRIDLKRHPDPKAINLNYGETVERHMIDDDFIIFNRQPTLHKMSMMCHRVKVLPFSTFRLNLSVTAPYNADFDGDEMNLHMPQTQESRAEVAHLARVNRLVITPQSNKPVMSIVQDSLTACDKMTRRDVFLNKAEMMNLLMFLPAWNGVMPRPTIMKPQRLWSGKQLFSLIIPKGINFTRTHSTHNDDEDNGPYKWITHADTKVYIENGQLLSGILCKKSLGSSSGSLIHVIAMEHNYEVIGHFFNDVQRVVNNWLLIEGHSIGIVDCLYNVETRDSIKSSIFVAKDNVFSIIEKGHKKELKCLPGRTLKETFEDNVNKILNEARDKTGTIAQKSLSKYNSFNSMVMSGAKGSKINISQVIACVGQQNVEGKRIPFGFNRRTLPHFLKDDFGSESRGFVENSYLAGLTPSEFYFHAMGGREGIIDTAIKTAETGYIQRRLVKAMESVKVEYDGTVRNQINQIFQFKYGEDGLDGGFVEFQHFPTYKIDNLKFEKKFRFQYDDIKQLRKFLTEKRVKEILQYKSEKLICFDKEYEQLCVDRKYIRETLKHETGGRLPLPCNIERLIWNAQKIFKIDTLKITDIKPMDIIEKVKDLCDSLSVVKGEDRISKEANENSKLYFCILLRSTLACKVVIDTHRLSQGAFEWVIGEIQNNFSKAMVHPGEMVGALAAESLGEPATQMTLNTFHFAGVSAKNVTLGVPRLREIINVSRNPKTPSLSIRLLGKTAKDVELAKKVAARLEHTTLRKLTKRSEIYYDPEPMESVIEKDRDWVRTYYELADDDVKHFSPYVLRVVLNRKKVIDKKLTLLKISETISDYFLNDITCHVPDDNLDLVLRIRMKKQEVNKEEDDAETIDDKSFLEKLENILLDNVTLQGIPQITKVYLSEPTTGDKLKKIINAEGSFEIEKEWILETDGTCLKRVLSERDVDPLQTTSNHISEIFEVLGIEAARNVIEYEMNNILSFDGSYVNYRHLALLCDVMTHKGFLMSMDRHGINRQETGALARSTFEETVDILLSAGAHAEIDPMKGVSESVLFGQLANMGTGSFDIMMNTEMLNEAQPLPIMTGIASKHINSSLHSPSPQYHYNQMSAPFSANGSGASFSPIICSPGMSPFGNNQGYTPSYSPIFSPKGPGCFSTSPTDSSKSPGFLSNSPAYSATSPAYSATSPGYSANNSSYSPTSPGYSPASPGYSPTSPGYSPTSPGYSPTSPGYSPTSPGYSLTSPGYSSTSPGYSPTSPGYSPTSPGYSPTSPGYSPTSPGYSPTSPGYSPTSPGYSPTSPGYSPTSPGYSPTSPGYSPTSPGYSPTSPGYSPTSPGYSPASPGYSPANPSYSPTIQRYSTSYNISSPNLSPSYTPSFGASNNTQGRQYNSPANQIYTPSSPNYSPSSPNYSPNLPNYSTNSPKYSPNSPNYSPSSPSYSPSSPNYSPSSPNYSPSSPNYAPNSSTATIGVYSPTSPTFSPTTQGYLGKKL